MFEKSAQVIEQFLFENVSFEKSTFSITAIVDFDCLYNFG